MSSEEQARHDLHVGLVECLGPERAGTLMSYLPPVGWADVATKRDLDALEERMEHRFEAIEQRFEARFEGLDHRFESVEYRFEAVLHREIGALRGDLVAQSRMLFFSMLATMLTLAGLAFAAARLD